MLEREREREMGFIHFPIVDLKVVLFIFFSINLVMLNYDCWQYCNPLVELVFLLY
jgi:hypothetical protein